MFGEAARSVGEGAAKLAEVRERFGQDYGATLGAVLARGLPTALCTVYDPRLTDPLRQRLGVTGLALFNDVITRAAFAQGLPVSICGSSATKTRTSPTRSRALSG